MGNTFKKVKYFLGLIGASGVLITSTPAKAGKYVFYDIEASGTYKRPSASVKTVPEVIRTVPIHKNDGGGSIRAIVDGPLENNPGSLNLEAELGIGIEKNKFDFRFGTRLEYLIIGDAGVQEQNYKGVGRTRGAALVYYGFSDDSEDGILIPNVVARVSRWHKTKGSWWNPTDGAKRAVFIEYSAGFYNLAIENGWDRFDGFETKERFKLAKLLDHSVLIGYGNKTKRKPDDFVLKGVFVWEVFGGIAIPQILSKTDLGKETGAETQPYLVIGGKMGWGGNTK